MIIYRLFLLILCVSAIVTGCSDVGFDSVPKLTCGNVSRDQNTTCYNGLNDITISFTFGVGDVDILFIDDNSGSMYVEQKKMANAFPNFLSKISNLFYQIAIITTDVSASPGNGVLKTANGNGKFQDGKFLEFVDEAKKPSGLFIIDKNTPNVSGLFKGTIQRDETLYCDGSGFNPLYCPSNDERGIYAANLAIKRGDDNFFRPGAHLAIVVLSDEDERGQAGRNGAPSLETDDLAETLVMNLKKQYPTKSVSVHSVVTNDESCRAKQTQTSTSGIWPTLGYIGTEYMKLSNPTQALRDSGNLMTGITGSICESDYGAQLGNISAAISDNTLDSPKQLACLPATNTIHLITDPVGYEAQVQYFIDNQNKIYFYNLPLGVKVSFSYDCPKF